MTSCCVATSCLSIDALIQTASLHWSLERIGLVERNILRVAIYELMYMPDIPPKVTINEAVEISKKNGAEEAWQFVNGILDRIKQDMDQRTQDRRSTCSSVSSTSPRAALPRG